MPFLHLNSRKVSLQLLLLAAVLFTTIVPGCTSVYKGLQPGSGNAACVFALRPAFSSSLYNTHVNVVGKHLSGLLLFKSMPDSSMRIVFSSEMGAKFFDFEYDASGNFKVHQVMEQLNKKAVINTLKTDFKLLLMAGLAAQDAVIKSDGTNTWYGFPDGKDTYYYITNNQCDSLVKIELAMKRKPKVQMLLSGDQHGVPDTIGISHRNFKFDIGLKYIPR